MLECRFLAERCTTKDTTVKNVQSFDAVLVAKDSGSCQVPEIAPRYSTDGCAEVATEAAE